MLKCYCCGEPVHREFALVSMSDEADRVFIVRNEHVKRMADTCQVVLVKQIKEKVM